MTPKIRLKRAILDALEGKPIDMDLLLCHDWGDLFEERGPARDAWLELQQWISDEDIRQRNSEYASAKRDRLLETLGRFGDV